MFVVGCLALNENENQTGFDSEADIQADVIVSAIAAAHSAARYPTALFATYVLNPGTESGVGAIEPAPSLLIRYRPSTRRCNETDAIEPTPTVAVRCSEISRRAITDDA